MTAFVVTPSLELQCVEKRGIDQVPAEYARVGCALCDHELGILRGDCSGFAITSIPANQSLLEYHFREFQTRFLNAMKEREHELYGSVLQIHGPFPSYDFVNQMVDINDSRLKDAQRRDENGDEHPELALPIVFERLENGFRDYIFRGMFLKKAQFTEVILDD